jgi:hypothetical protein
VQVDGWNETTTDTDGLSPPSARCVPYSLPLKLRRSVSTAQPRLQQAAPVEQIVLIVLIVLPSSLRIMTNRLPSSDMSKSGPDPR